MLAPVPRARVLCVVLGAALVACGGHSRPDPYAVAAAKCVLPLAERLNVPDGDQVEEQGVRVTDLGEGRRKVTGQVAKPGGSFHAFMCVVAPDSSDKLRGLRIESLTVQDSAG